jgi:hypothetical protein
MKNNITGKITAIPAAAVVLASAGVAWAQTNRHAGAQWLVPNANPYYNRDYWVGNPRLNGHSFNTFGPYAGTIFEGVVPY